MVKARSSGELATNSSLPGCDKTSSSSGIIANGRGADDEERRENMLRARLILYCSHSPFHSANASGFGFRKFARRALAIICRMSPPVPNTSKPGKVLRNRVLLSLHESGAYGARIRRQIFTLLHLGAFLLR